MGQLVKLEADQKRSAQARLAFIEGHDKEDKITFYAVLYAFIGKKRLKDALSNAHSDVK